MSTFTPGVPPPTSPPPPPTGAPPQGSSGRATASLVLGILGIITCCNVLSPVAWVLGNSELRAIARGASSPQGEGVARAGMILGIIGSVMLAFAVVWLMFLGGLATMAALFDH